MLQHFQKKSVVQITLDAEEEWCRPAPSACAFRTSCQLSPGHGCSHPHVNCCLGVFSLNHGVILSTLSCWAVCDTVISAFDYEVLCLSSAWRWPSPAARAAIFVRGSCIWKKRGVGDRLSRFSRLLWRCHISMWYQQLGEHRGHIQMGFSAWCLCTQPFWAATRPHWSCCITNFYGNWVLWPWSWGEAGRDCIGSKTWWSPWEKMCAEVVGKSPVAWCGWLICALCIDNLWMLWSSLCLADRYIEL